MVAIIGILAAVALPQFKKYIEKAKSTEFPLILNKLYQAEVVYYLTPQVPQSGTPENNEFLGLGSNPWINDVGSVKVAPDFSVGNWPNININIEGPVYGSYSVQERGINNLAAMTVRVDHDLDGDDLYLFTLMVASINAEGEVFRSPGFYESTTEMGLIL